MSRRTIAGLLAIVIAAVALFLAMRGGGEREGGNDRAAAGGNGSAGQQVGSGIGSGVGAPRPRIRVDDGAAGGTATSAGTGARGDRTYVTDTGNLVRDHRDNVREDVAVPAPLPPEQRTMNSMIASEIYRQIVPIVRGCGVDVPADARGPEPIVHVTLMVEVAGEKLSTTDATAVTSDVTGPAADKVVACVRDRAAALNVPAKGEPDRSGYVLQYPVRIR